MAKNQTQVRKQQIKQVELRPCSQLITSPVRGLIKCYQVVISPMLGPNCRFHPSCSCYAQEALQTHGLLKGSWLTIKRIVKCNPMHPGGFDYVPGTKQRNNQNLK